MADSDACPAAPDETAEAYLLRRLSPEGTRVFEDHFMTCARCTAIVKQTKLYVASMKRAAQCLREAAKAPDERN